MFWKKKNVKKHSETCNKVKELEKDLLFNIRPALEHWAEQCYIRNAAMCCYVPMTLDWEVQDHRCRNAQEKLKNAMAVYDNTRQQIINLRKSEPDSFESWDTEPADSHYVVEKALEALFED